MDSETKGRISKSYHFQSHVLFGIDNEPLSSCVAGNKLLLSTLGHSIEVRNLDNYGSLSHSFCTVDLVKQMLYSDIGKYIATLEVKTTRLNLSTHVRLYFNWQMNLDGVPMRARIAGRVTPSSQSGVGQLEMVELPLKHQACHVNCCGSTANLVIGCGRCVCIYRFCVKIHPISKLQFQDVEHLLDIYVTFPVKEVALCEEFVACMSSCEVQVVKFVSCSQGSIDPKIKDVKPSVISSKSSNGSSIEDDENLLLLSEPLDNQLLKLSLDSLPTTILLPSLLDMSKCEFNRCKGPRLVMGPLDYFAGYPTKVEFVDTKVKPYKIINLLYQRFPTILPTNSTPYFCLHSLQFLPFYIASNQQSPVNSASDVFRSPRRTQLRRVEVFFSGQSEGHLYDITDKVFLISTYNYIGNCRVYHVSVENTFLHAVGNGGVQTYSLGNWNRIIQHFVTDKPDKQPYFYSFNLQNVLLGFHPFVGVKLATFGDGFLVLLTCNNEMEANNSESNWTTYALQCSLAEEIYNTYIEDEYSLEDEENEKWYLLHDAHCALAIEVLLYNPPSTSRLFRLFQEASYQLGAFYLRFDVWSSVAFYWLGGGSIDSRIKHILESSEENSAIDKIKLCSVISLIFLKNCFETSEELSEENANMILKIVNENNTSLISTIILKKIFRGFDNYLAQELLSPRIKDRKCPNVEDTLAACICCAATGLVHCIPNFLLFVSNESILSMVSTYPHVWITDSDQNAIHFTPLMQVVQQIKPDLFIQILISLITSGIIDGAIVTSQLCQTDFWEDYGLDTKNNVVLLNYLEEILKNKVVCDEAVLSLICLYIKDLSEEETFTLPSQTKPWRLFGIRQQWLNRLPPFLGRSISKENCILKSSEEGNIWKEEDELSCPCSYCNDCLLRLQSLLCSEISTPEVKSKVLRVLEDKSNVVIKGEESIKVLCCESAIESVRRLSSTYQNAVIEYCKENVGKNEVLKWKEILEMLNITNNEDENLIEGLITYLAEILSPVELAKLIPYGRFPSQMIRAINKHRAKQIFNLIVDEGNAMTKT